MKLNITARWLMAVSRRMNKRRFDRVQAEGGMSFTDRDLVYAARSRCPCGAGLAYPKGCGPAHYWDCSSILKGEALPKGAAGSKTHCARYPFIFYEIKSEQQPSAEGATTRL